MAEKDGGNRIANFRVFCTIAALVAMTAYYSLNPQLSTRLRQGETTNHARFLSNVFSDHETTTRTWTTPTGVEIQTRIVGGTDVTDPNLFPSYGFNAGDGLCGGTLIYPDIVLTAAHCTTIFNDGWQQGGITLDGLGSQRVNVAQSVPHPDYEPGPEYNDIMLVKLAEPIVDAPIQKLNFNPDVPSDGTTVTVIGFGNTADGGQASFQLQQVQSTTVSFDVCNSYYGTIIDEQQICMDGTKGKDSCQGDSGGPLFLEDGTQIGIVSYGVGCADPNVPASVFTRISGYEQWINDNICELSSQPPPSCAGVSTSSPVASPIDAPSPPAMTEAPIAAPVPTVPSVVTEAPIVAPVPTMPSGVTGAPIAASVPTEPSMITGAPMGTQAPLSFPISVPTASGTGVTTPPSPVTTTPAQAPTTGSTAAPNSPTSATAVPAAPIGTTSSPNSLGASPTFRPVVLSEEEATQSPATIGAPTVPLTPTSILVPATKAPTSENKTSKGSSKGMHLKGLKGMRSSSPSTQRNPEEGQATSAPDTPPVNSPTGKLTKGMKSKGGRGGALALGPARESSVPPPVNSPAGKSNKGMKSKRGNSGATSNINGQREKRWDVFASGIGPPANSGHDDKSKKSDSKGKSTKGNRVSNIFERDNPDDGRVERVNRLWSMIAAARRDDRVDENETIDRDIQQ